jgi:hypothetical protein
MHTHTHTHTHTTCSTFHTRESSTSSSYQHARLTYVHLHTQYLINIGNKVPVQLNFVDYCTDEIIFTTYFTVIVDDFSVINVPCTFSPARCSLLPQDKQQACQEGFARYTNPNGAFRCGNSSDFYSKSMVGRVCNAANYDKRRAKNANQTLWNWVPGEDKVELNQNSGELVEEVGYCTCNRTDVRARLNLTADRNLTMTVPDGFVKVGMATYYVQLVIGGRKTSDPEPGCRCEGPDDTSEACMCMLGTKKIPYIYNNSFIPYFTALVSIRNGGLLFTNTYIKYNFDSNGMGEFVPVFACCLCPLLVGVLGKKDTHDDRLRVCV